MIAFYLDEDCQSDAYVGAIRRAGLLVTTVNEQKTNGHADERQLMRASEHSWVIVTRNVRDFPRLHQEWEAGGLAHAGIV